ncbi:hypothetical protein ACVBE9_09800 [Eionea flava]
MIAEYFTAYCYVVGNHQCLNRLPFLALFIASGIDVLLMWGFTLCLGD